MTRLSSVDPWNLSPEQKELYDSIAGGPRAAKRPGLVDAEGHLTGPFNAYLHCPTLGKHWSAIGETLRFGTALDRRLFELAILVIAAHWHSGHEWAAHSGLARAAGIAEEAIAVLRRGGDPSFEKPDEQAVYDFVRELITSGRVSQTVYDAAGAVLGEVELVELANAVGYYLALAAMLNAFDVHPPAGLDDPWP
jgi:4-carboxymuconolactone decarboxylase